MIQRPELAGLIDEFTQFRRDLHRHPELAFTETRTATLISDRLRQYGITVTTHIGGTGVVGVLRRGSGSKSIGLRADTDALPIHEHNQFRHASQTAGIMHACGHDGHTSMLLMAAKYLAQHGKFNGSIVFIFQPAEEIGQGANKMIEDGLFVRFPVDAIYGLHNVADLPAGHLGAVVGPITAGSSIFRITVQGQGSHAAMPHHGHDPLFTGMQIASALQGIISREKDPLDSAVLSVTEFHSGEVLNAVPDSATLAGAVRTFKQQVTDLIENRMRTIAENISTAFGCQAQVEFERFCPPTINSAKEAALALAAMGQMLEAKQVHTGYLPSMAAEDFACFLQHKPGCYANIGNGLGEHRETLHGDGPCLVHNPSYDFNDGILYTGANYWVTLAETYLAGE